VERLESKIRAIPNFPHKGTVYRDITPIVKDPVSLRVAVLQLIHPFLGERITAVAGMEARGFIFGSLSAWELGVGFIPLRKPGKLPYEVQTASYEDGGGAPSAIEAHIDSVCTGDRVLLVDDVLATGMDAAASCELLRELGAEIAACAFLVEIDELGGRAKLEPYRVYSIIHY
jgi:adenine phosphoribosyltransferase